MPSHNRSLFADFCKKRGQTSIVLELGHKFWGCPKGSFLSGIVDFSDSVTLLYLCKNKKKARRQAFRKKDNCHLTLKTYVIVWNLPLKQNDINQFLSFHVIIPLVEFLLSLLRLLGDCFAQNFQLCIQKLCKNGSLISRFTVQPFMNVFCMTFCPWLIFQNRIELLQG